MSAQMEQLSEMSKEASESIDGTHSEFDREILRVVRDLYRFFKLYRNRKNLRDPFVSFFDFTALPIVGEVLTEEESIIPFTEFYFKRGLYAEALPLLEKLSTLRPEDSSVWEKIGFSRQSTRDFTGALEAYRRAELFKTPGPWLLKKIAYINKRLGNNAESAEYYRRALDSDPENASLLMSLGNVLILLNRPEEASAQFYHANYIRPSDPKIMRSIGWTELLKKNPIKSLDYYRRVLSIDPNPSDYLNAGHASLLTGDMKGAVEYYRKTFSDEETDGFMKAYNSDIPTLLSLGADPQILRLVADYLLLSE